MKGKVDINVDWGDLSPIEHIEGNYLKEDPIPHRYTHNNKSENYTVRIWGTVETLVVTDLRNPSFKFNTIPPEKTFALRVVESLGYLRRGGCCFENCNWLNEVKGGFTNDVINMNSMFYNCKELTTIQTKSWDVSNVTSMDSMFHYCYKLISAETKKLER